jgi:hypothetical protein
MADLARHFRRRDELLDPLMALMLPHERLAFRSLQSSNPATFAACFHGLQRYLGFGPLASYPAQHQPMKYFAEQILPSYGWIQKAEQEQAAEKANTNGNGKQNGASK